MLEAVPAVFFGEKGRQKNIINKTGQIRMSKETVISAYRIVLADDLSLTRLGLRMILSQSSEFKIVGEAGDGRELLNLLTELSPDMVIMDVSMPNLNGIEAIAEIRAMRPHVDVLVITMNKNLELLNKSISAGTKGYLLKEDACEELFSAIDKIRQEKIYISPRFSEDLAKSEKEKITIREKLILKLTAEGKTARQISDVLFISPRTVENHRYNIMRKLNLKKSSEIVRYAFQKGYV
jgi:two-component system, NarL family, response regulator NreC